MVAHLVHKNAEGKLAVVAVLLDKGGANPTIETIWKNIPKEKEKEAAVDATIDAATLLPSEQRLLRLPGFAHHAALQRGSALAGPEASRQDRRPADRGVRQAVFDERPAHTAPAQPLGRGHAAISATCSVAPVLDVLSGIHIKTDLTLGLGTALHDHLSR